MHRAALVKTLDLGAYGGAELFFGDINLDGHPEIVAYQGSAVIGARLYARMDDHAPFLARSTCVTAFDLNGRRLWTWGEPNDPDRPYVSHAYESCISIGDADNDGKAEVAVALGNAVILLDGLTGKEKQSASLPEDYYYIVQVLGRPTASHEAALVLKNGEEPYEYAAGAYAQPAIGLNADLKMAWGPVAIPGAGHYVLTIRTQADDTDDFLVGYCAVKPDGRLAWMVDSVDRDRLDALNQHVDYSVLWREPEGRRMGAMAGSDRGYVVEDGGRTRFTMTEGHVQAVAVGRFQGGKQVQVAFYNAPDGPIVLFDRRGQRLWRADTPRLDEQMNPLSLPPGSARDFHRNRPIITVPGVERDWIGYADGGWPWGMDGTGKIALTFPPPPSEQRIAWSQAPLLANNKNRLDDMGYGYAMQSLGAFGSPAPQVVLYTRRFVWFYTLS